jgi:hypothetical protein
MRNHNLSQVEKETWRIRLTATMSDCAKDDCPYDEARSELLPEQQLQFQTSTSMRSLSGKFVIEASHRHSAQKDGIGESKHQNTVSVPRDVSSLGKTRYLSHPWKWDLSALQDKPMGSLYRGRPSPSYSVGLLSPRSEPATSATPSGGPLVTSVVAVGEPRHQVFRTILPPSLLPLLPIVVAQCEQHVSWARGGNWKTHLYSLTKQDVPVSEIPGGTELTQALTDFVVRSIQDLYGPRAPNFDGGAASTCTPEVGASRAPSVVVHMDRNQPHVLKYCAGHTGVGPHYDRCDVTACLLLSDPRDYRGGGTHFPSVTECGVGGGTTVWLDRGELLLHPGRLVHSGRDISSGSRYLLVWFCHLQYT